MAHGRRSKVAALYDIHGNLLALEAVLSEIEHIGDVDAIVVGGDVVWGPNPKGVLDRLLKMDGQIHFIKGNMDREVAGRYGVSDGVEAGEAEMNAWIASKLSVQQMEFLSDLQQAVTLDIAGLGRVRFVHASPRSDTEGIRLSTSEADLRAIVSGVGEETVVCGHTHVQMNRWACGKRIVNAGSVGLPFGTTSACWALLGPDILLRRTVYDYEAAAVFSRDSGAPMGADFASQILRPPV